MPSEFSPPLAFAATGIRLSSGLFATQTATEQNFSKPGFSPSSRYLARMRRRVCYAETFILDCFPTLGTHACACRFGFAPRAHQAPAARHAQLASAGQAPAVP